MSDNKNIRIVVISVLLLLAILYGVLRHSGRLPVLDGSPITPSVTGRLYVHTNPAFELHYPEGFSVNERYVNQSLGGNKKIPGVAFFIATSTSEGTNLGPDTFVSVEWKEGKNCSLNQFIDSPSSVHVTENGISYEVASTTGVGAGNIYEDTVYLHGCIAVRYFIHSANIHNYEPGAVREFDRGALISSFDYVRRSLNADAGGDLI